MKAERQQKERTSRVLQLKSNRVIIEDNRPHNLYEVKIINDIQQVDRNYLEDKNDFDFLYLGENSNRNNLDGNAIQRSIEVDNELKSVKDILSILNLEGNGYSEILELWSKSLVKHNFTTTKNKKGEEKSARDKILDALKAAKDMPSKIDLFFNKKNLKFITKEDGRLPTLYFDDGNRTGRLRQQHSSGPLAKIDTQKRLRIAVVSQNVAEQLIQALKYDKNYPNPNTYGSDMKDGYYLLEGINKDMHLSGGVIGTANGYKDADIAKIYYSIIPRGDQNQSRCCYLTTACVTHKGLSDDCEELTILRYFRDTYLINKPNGKDLITMYYARAPYILANIHKRRKEEEEMILESIYGIVRECVDAILSGDNEFAFRTYCDMVVRLDSEYGN